MKNKRRSSTPRWVPVVCGLLTLIGAVAWDQAAIIAGFATVALWGPATTLVEMAIDTVGAVALRSSARRIRSVSR